MKNRKGKGNITRGDEILKTIGPSKDIVCKDCLFRSDGTVWSNDYRKASCDIYKYPAHKPHSVLFENGPCEFYVRDPHFMLKDALYGFAVGDALGVPYEFKKRGTFRCTDMVGHGTWDQPEGTWSDDTSMTLATAKSITTHYEVQPADIYNNFKLWYHDAEFTAHGEVFDVGGTTQKAITTGQAGTSINSNGNGSLMRILPLAFIDATTEEIEAVSSLTHAHNISTRACVIYCHILNELIYKKSDIKKILGELKEPEPFHRLSKIYELREDEIKSSGYVVDTLEAALWCVSTTDNYKDCVLKAVNLGDDTDTTAAIAGGLAGLIYGFDNIPKEWKEKLANKELIDSCLFPNDELMW